jgi:hypothetical protein
VGTQFSQRSTTPVQNEFNAQTQDINNTFVAPTVAALLGLPVPRQVRFD